MVEGKDCHHKKINRITKHPPTEFPLSGDFVSALKRIEKDRIHEESGLQLVDINGLEPLTFRTSSGCSTN